MKKYIQPSIVSREIELSQMIAESIGIDTTQFIDPDVALIKEQLDDNLFGNEDFGADAGFGNETWGSEDEW